jgi:sulfur-oxidizing protein SoxY
MTFTRRNILALGAGTVAAASFGALPAMASLTEDQIAAFTAPEIAENGNTVPVGVTAQGAASILVLATGNPNPAVATFNFGKLNPSQSASTRIRLAKTQDVVAVAKMQDGTFRQVSATVKVTIGGCGG